MTMAPRQIPSSHPREMPPAAGWKRWFVRYPGAIILTGVAFLIWFLWPVVRQDPFSVFIAAVIVSARVLGFGPAVLCTLSSVVALDYFVLPPHYDLTLSSGDLDRMVMFVMVSLLTAGLARQRSRAEGRASEADQRMAAIVRSSRDAILSTTLDGSITSWNPGAEELYGYTSEEAVGHHISFISAPEQRAEITGVLLHVQRGEPVVGERAEHLRKDGSRIIVLLSFSPLRGAHGTVTGCSAIIRDITTQTRAEEALRKNEKLAAAGRLAATVAHEINNPLEAITNLLYLARQDTGRRDEYLTMAEDEVQRVASIAEQTLGFVRETSSVDLDVGKLLDQVLKLYSRKLDSKHIHVEKEYQSDVRIRGFAGELRQLFANLVINAVDASAENGRLRLRISHYRNWGNSHGGVRVTIADTGSGIGPGHLRHIFEPFYTTKKDIGTGLGLWLSHGIVQKHGGSIRVRTRSLPGRSGTVFTVFLPQMPVETATGEPGH
jgi:PAS domain S-box-containing protein